MNFTNITFISGSLGAAKCWLLQAAEQTHQQCCETYGPFQGQDTCGLQMSVQASCWGGGASLVIH